MSYQIVFTDELYHHGIKGQKWGVRRWQNEDGTFNTAGKKRYGFLNPESNIRKDGYQKSNRKLYGIRPDSKNDIDKVNSTNKNIINTIKSGAKSLAERNAKKRLEKGEELTKKGKTAGTALLTAGAIVAAAYVGKKALQNYTASRLLTLDLDRIVLDHDTAVQKGKIAVKYMLGATAITTAASVGAAKQIGDYMSIKAYNKYNKKDK